MKTVRFAYIIFILLFIGVFVNSTVLGKIFTDLDELVKNTDAGDIENAEARYTAIYEKYKSFELFISLTVSHDDLTELENCFSEIIGAAKANDKTGVITTKNRLTEGLSHIRRLSGINIDSIF